jgi:hypothetical protein
MPNLASSVDHLLRNQLNNATSLGNLLLGELRDVAGPDDERDLGDAALAEDLGVTEREQVEHRCRVLLLT